MKLIPTRVHGMLDYVSAGALFALPRLMGWTGGVNRLLTGAALATLAYSLLTRYELGVFRVLPFKGHLGIDTVQALAIGAAPLFFPHEPGRVRTSLGGIGLYELAVILNSQTEPAGERVSIPETNRAGQV